MYNANVGDSAAVLGKAEAGEKISGFHHVDNDEEYDRVEAKRMNIFMDRLGGVLLITRAFGDKEVQKCELIVTPTVFRIVLTEEHKCLIVASDGVWDGVQPDDAVKLVNEADSAVTAAEQLVKKALENDSRDNISTYVIKL